MKLTGNKSIITAIFDKNRADELFVELRDKFYNMTCQNHRCSQHEKKITKRNFNITNWISGKENTLMFQLTDDLCCKEFEWKIQEDFVKEIKDKGGDPKIKLS